MSANFRLIGAMNPCPCGWPSDRCACPPAAIERHLARVKARVKGLFEVTVTVPAFAKGETL